MSLKPDPIQPVPEETARVARAAFRKGNPLLRLRDELGAIFADADFADLFPKLGQPGLPPWRLALVTLLQFRENLPDRQAAEAVRARIDWKYLLGLELTDPGFDHSVLCEFRSRLLDGQRRGAPAAQAAGGLPERAGCSRRAAGSGPTRPTSLASIRALNRLELVGETLRAALNELATWPRTGCAAPPRRPGTSATRTASRTAGCRRPRPNARPTPAPSARTGSRCSTGSTSPRRPRACGRLPTVEVLRRVWARHFVREGGAPPGGGACGSGARTTRRPSAEPVESPYDPEARFRTRSGTSWTGYVVHLSETCEDDTVHLLTHAMTTVATVHEARCTAAIHAGLGRQGPVAGRAPGRRGLRRRRAAGAQPRGAGHRPGRPAAAEPVLAGQGRGRLHDRPLRGRLGRAAGALPAGQAVLGLEPPGRPGRHALRLGAGSARPTAAACPARPLVHAGQAPGPAPEAAAAGRARGAQGAPAGGSATKEGRRRYARRAGIEGTLSQGVRAFGLRRSRYRGLAKTHLQHVATAAAINLERLAAWFRAVPRAATRTSRFAALAA